MDLSIAAEIYGKYGVTGVFVLLGVWLVVDSRNQQKLFTSLIVEKLDEVRMAVGRRTMDASETLATVREKVWWASLDKLEFIKETLEANHISERSEEIRSNIRSKLEELSQAYIDELNKYNTPLSRLGDAVADAFDFEPFFQELMLVVLRPVPKEAKPSEYNAVKMKDIEGVMRKWQNKMATRISKQLVSKCSNCLISYKP